jgi:hypothetical protein
MSGAGALGRSLVVMSLATFAHAMNYRKGRRYAEANPMSPDEVERARTEAMAGRFGGKTFKMEPFRVHSNPAYAAKRERQFLTASIALIAAGVLILVLA